MKKYKTQIVLTHIPQNYQTNLDKYCVEVWYNFDSMCRIINGYTIEYNVWRSNGFYTRRYSDVAFNYKIYTD